MGDALFEWDEQKALSNAAKHGVDFVLAVHVFADDQAVRWPDRRRDYGEDRFLIVGCIDGRYLSVTYTLRGGRIRLISARLASVAERRRYSGA